MHRRAVQQEQPPRFSPKLRAYLNLVTPLCGVTYWFCPLCGVLPHLVTPLCGVTQWFLPIWLYPLCGQGCGHNAPQMSLCAVAGARCDQAVRPKMKESGAWPRG